ncbi:MAG: NADP-dependent oxidoreductase [Myxococcales bacterium]|nr:NADP-dependent oxidoreductase [Myxococcales bacterium]
MTSPRNRYYTLESRPVGELKDSDLARREAPVRAPERGEIQLRTRWISLDPTNRIWMSDMPQYMPPIELGDVVRALTLGVVERSAHPDYAEGDLVTGAWGWATHPTGTPEALGAFKLPALPIPETQALSLIGATSGMTAYFGLLEVARPKAGETLVVDAASGSVGALVGQLAKIKGLRVIGITGGREKCEYITDELGFDGAVDYKSEDVGAALDRLCPDGIDVCFENVGGSIFDAILLRMNLYGRVALCGMIESYNAQDKVPGPYAFGMILMRRLRVQGFICTDYAARFPEAIGELLGWAGAGKLKIREDLREGFDNLPESLRQLLRGEKLGKMLLRV